MLLERNDVNPDGVDKGGRAPLSWMAVNKRVKIEGMPPVLQRNGAHSDTADESGQTPFPWAGNGWRRVVLGQAEYHDPPPM